MAEMRKSLAESEREELLAELTEAHNVVSKVLSELRSRYSLKSPTMKAAIKAEWAVFHVKRELLRMDVEKTPVVRQNFVADRKKTGLVYDPVF